MGTWFGIFSAPGARMRAHGLVYPLFIAKPSGLVCPMFVAQRGNGWKIVSKTMKYVATIMY